MKRPVIYGLITTLFLLLSWSFAGTSLKLGATFPGWDKEPTYGSVYNSAESLIKGYARQIGHSCFTPEVFYRSGTSSLITAVIFYEPYLPYGSNERVLLDSYDQRVSLVSPRFGSDVLVVLAPVSSGTFLILC